MSNNLALFELILHAREVIERITQKNHCSACGAMPGEPCLNHDPDGLLGFCIATVDDCGIHPARLEPKKYAGLQNHEYWSAVAANYPRYESEG